MNTAYEFSVRELTLEEIALVGGGSGEDPFAGDRHLEDDSGRELDRPGGA